MTLLKFFLGIMSLPILVAGCFIFLGSKSAFHEMEAMLLGLMVLMLWCTIAVLDGLQWAANQIGRKIAASATQTKAPVIQPAAERIISERIADFTPPPMPVVDVEVEAEQMYQRAKELAAASRAADARSQLDAILADFPGTQAAAKARRSLTRARA